MKPNKTKGSVLAFSLGILLIAVFLQTGGLLKGNRIVFPGLPEIGEALVRLLVDGRTWLKIGTTMLHVAEALFLSAVIGILIGLLEGSSGFAYSFFRPVMILIRSTPMILLVILIMATISYRAVPVVSACMILIPLFSEAVYEGCRSIDPELIDVYRLNGGFSARVAFQVYLPLISGYLKQAFNNAAGMGLKVAVSAEYLVQARDSLGKAVYLSSYSTEYAEVYAYALIMIFLVLLLTELPGKISAFVQQKRTGKLTSPG